MSRNRYWFYVNVTGGYKGEWKRFPYIGNNPSAALYAEVNKLYQGMFTSVSNGFEFTEPDRIWKAGYWEKE
jgi:hypothetical protein